ncbi:hypothetical protein [Pedobacter sp. MR2016-24]|uniref:hypothetical protein n=1 Tax=Pedobacter sp. MR2016-24 TaxID=2994466 RepID=UPI00224614E1|nr:hypothetical protein [Pedobacter sp. MR2016-24]MCX2482839.1 hypothetical protein [Pedobacter sp. MR2016-24]
MNNSFEKLYLGYKTKYIYRHGQAKFNTIEFKVQNSSKIAQLNSLSIQQRTEPSQGDFGVAIQSMAYFIFSGGDTCAMAEFIATKHWDETVNYRYEFCDEEALARKGQSILNKWHKNIK